MKKILIYTSLITFGYICKAQTITDIDGNTYNTVTIGDQVWVKENLKTTKYNDGTAISNITDNAKWNLTSKTPAFCWYNNDAITYKDLYGALYNWYAIDASSNGDKNICPIGWHVPDEEEWVTLINYLGGYGIAGGKLKESGTVHWNTPNTGATNESNFTALPDGGRNCNDGSFDGTIGNTGRWWSSTYDIDLQFAYIVINNDNSGVFKDYDAKCLGLSIRCIKDNNTFIKNFDCLDVLTFYPNPASNMLYLMGIDYLGGQLMIYDLQGKLQYNRLINSKSIDLSNLKKGIYTVKFINATNVIVGKLIKK